MGFAHTYDTETDLKAAGLVASSAAGSIIVDLGVGHARGDLVLEVTALEIASNDETYTITLQGSPDSDFGTAGNIQDLVSVNLAAKEVKATSSDKDDTTGRLIVPFSNQFMDTNYRYVRLYTVVAGTITTGIDYSAYLSK